MTEEGYADAYSEEIEQSIKENDEVMQEDEEVWKLARLYTDENTDRYLIKLKIFRERSLHQIILYI